jgi:hypothetical protein
VDNRRPTSDEGGGLGQLSTFCERGLPGHREAATVGTVTQHSRPQPTGTPVLLHRTALLAEGFSDNHIRRALREGALTAISPGVYLRETEARALGAAARHQVAVGALTARLSGDPVISHVSAAIMHGLPFVYSELPPVHVTRAGAAKSRRGSGLMSHRGALTPGEVVMLGGLPVTTVARTVVDCALLLPFANAVVLTDAALHRQQVTPGALVTQLRLHPRVPGMRTAADVIGFADRRSAGVGESYSRVLLRRAGLPPPELRVTLSESPDQSLGVAAFGYREQRVLGEFDGHDGPTPHVLARDELRRDAGWQVLRWAWTDLCSPGALIVRLASALRLPIPRAAASLLGDGDLDLGGI